MFCLKKIPGVEAFFSAKDIPGENTYTPIDCQLISIVENEVIFIEIDTEVKFYGQPCGVIVAKTMALANLAATQVEIVYEKVKESRYIIPSIFHRRKDEIHKTDTKHFSLPSNQEVKIQNVENQVDLNGNFLKIVLFHIHET